MIIAILIVLGLCIGSFVNALVWRVHEQLKSKKKPDKKLSITKGRSMCPHCKHELESRDLIPVVSWVLLAGKCRYCKKPISWQYPLVELATAALFLLSYLYWPYDLSSTIYQLSFILWLAVLAGFVTLIVYDLRWMLLPNRIVGPLLVLIVALAILNLLDAGSWNAALETLYSIAIGGGIFYLIFQLSGGKMIGGGDVKLGFIIGLLLQNPFHAFLMLLLASTLGTIAILPGLAIKKVNFKSRIPFGPFLVAAAIIVFLFGTSLVEWYKTSILGL